jgi:hypothetical protein
MTAKQVKASFAAHARKPLWQSINDAIEKQKQRIKENPEEAREMWIRAGVMTRTGRLTKPYRMMIKRDEEDEARKEEQARKNAGK